MMDIDSKVLAACPFCGGDAHHTTIRYTWAETVFHYVYCGICGANNRSMLGFRYLLEAYAHWNKRSPATELVERAFSLADEMMLSLLENSTLPGNDEGTVRLVIGDEQQRVMDLDDAGPMVVEAVRWLEVRGAARVTGATDGLVITIKTEGAGCQPQVDELTAIGSSGNDIQTLICAEMDKIDAADQRIGELMDRAGATRELETLPPYEHSEVLPEPHQRIAFWIAMLSGIGEISIHRLSCGYFWVSVKRDDATPLWLFQSALDLDKALQAVANKAVSMRFLDAGQVERIQAVGRDQATAFESWYLDVLRGHPNNLRKTADGTYVDPHVSHLVGAWLTSAQWVLNGDQCLAQPDLFGGDHTVLSNTTAIYPNRISDKAKVERLLGLPEHADGAPVAFRTPKGTLFATTYVRIVYGDHGPYVEFSHDQVVCPLKKKFGNQPLKPEAYYEWLVPADKSGVKVYDQKRDVRHVRNAPAGGFAGNRPEGYADYRPGFIYVSPWELEVRVGGLPRETATVSPIRQS